MRMVGPLSVMAMITVMMVIVAKGMVMKVVVWLVEVVMLVLVMIAVMPVVREMEEMGMVDLPAPRHLGQDTFYRRDYS